MNMCTAHKSYMNRMNISTCHWFFCPATFFLQRFSSWIKKGVKYIPSIWTFQSRIIFFGDWNRLTSVCLHGHTTWSVKSCWRSRGRRSVTTGPVKQMWGNVSAACIPGQLCIMEGWISGQEFVDEWSCSAIRTCGSVFITGWCNYWDVGLMKSAAVWVAWSNRPLKPRPTVDQPDYNYIEIWPMIASGTWTGAGSQFIG